MDNKMIACCGLDCSHCDARVATLGNDNALREKTARLWCELNSTDAIKPEHINCLGCLSEGTKTYYCTDFCPIRKCCLAKGFSTCALCPDKKACAHLAALKSDEAKTNIGL